MTDREKRLFDAVELAWGLIANATDFDHGSDEWTAAAVRWRDEHWHSLLREIAPSSEADLTPEELAPPTRAEMADDLR